LFHGDAVVAELTRKDFPGQAAALRLVRATKLLPTTDEAAGVARVYVEHFLAPDDPVGDALHLAVACVHAMDYPLTWNCRHLANENKVRHLQAVNRRLGLMTPVILTPEMLILQEPIG